ncbi:MAG: leucyl aminopeptidase family protein [Phycisphaerales bacterium JB039]
MFKSVRASSSKSPQVLVVGHFKGKALDSDTKKLDADGAIAAALKRGEATGEAGAMVECFPTGKGAPGRIILCGLGEADKLKPGAMRALGAAVGRRLATTKETSVQFALAGPLNDAKVDLALAGCALGEGLGLIGWTCDQFRGKANEVPKRTDLKVDTDDKKLTAGLKRGLGLAEGANLARTLSETPPNIATPEFMAKECQKLARATGMKCTVIKGAALEREKLTGLINVGKASENAPCLIRLEYRPGGTAGSGGAGGKKPLVLVGKTMTYDSGGLSIKVGGGMRGMKRDKDGGCAVIGAMHNIATVIKPKRPVVALLAAAENSISDEAYRPDDIITYRNGVTVEVTNTDAEGRLVLADALCWACEKERPQAIVDIATLTGGVVTALGSTFAGMWCDDDNLREHTLCAAEGAGERVWRLPHDEEYRKMMKSQVADIINSNPNRKAHPIQGAAFLSYFVEEGIPWCHLDIAGVHAVEGDSGPFVTGPTGFGARLMALLAEQV